MSKSSWLFLAFASASWASAVASGCGNSSDSQTGTPIAGSGGNGGATTEGTGGATSSSHSSSHSSSSSSHASSSSSSGSTGGAGGAPPHCSDSIRDHGESDVDCGGECPGCDDGLRCMSAADCQSGVCGDNQLCAQASCTDGVQNGEETDEDCGGTVCAGCDAGQTCGGDADCADDRCVDSACVAASCTDHRRNGDESDIDCGGSCAPCNPGQLCGAPHDCVGGVCQVTHCGCPQGMIIVPVSGGSVEYCIDAVEVTYTAYEVFYANNPDTASQPAFCSWNTDYTPTGDWPQPDVNKSQPVRFVNWCQADAYCRYAGRHLCHGIQGVALATADLIDPDKDQWFNACSAQGHNDYPYGNTVQETECNGLGNPATGPWTTTTNTCLGGAPGLFDMSGNVAEWEDACDATSGPNDSCPVRGGDFQSVTDAEARCDSGGVAPTLLRDYAGRDVGFRCCL